MQLKFYISRKVCQIRTQVDYRVLSEDRRVKNSSGQIVNGLDDHLDGEREKVDLLQRLDLAVLDQAAQLGNGHPFLEAQ